MLRRKTKNIMVPANKKISIELDFYYFDYLLKCLDNFNKIKCDKNDNKKIVIYK